MIETVAFKPNLLQATERLDAWWTGEILDRPPLSFRVRPTRPYNGPPNPTTMGDRWLNVDAVIARAIASLEQRDFLAETMPIYSPNLGPEITAALWGCPLKFSEGTSWSEPIIDDPGRWEPLAAAPPDFENPHWQLIEELTTRAIELSRGRFLVGMTDLHGAYDTLAALRDPEDLCLDLVDCPHVIDRVARNLSRGIVATFNRNYGLLAAAGQGSTCWTPFYYRGPAYVPSCDFWCMLDSAMARELVLPTILMELEPLERSVFHLDGPQALRHLDLLLEIPNLHAVQWIYGAGNGPAARWIDVYKRIAAAGKSIQVVAASPEDAMTVLEAVGPRRVWFTSTYEFDSIDSANAFVKDVERFTREHS